MGVVYIMSRGGTIKYVLGGGGHISCVEGSYNPCLGGGGE